jgi:hypothetical protein
MLMQSIFRTGTGSSLQDPSFMTPECAQLHAKAQSNVEMRLCAHHHHHHQQQQQQQCCPAAADLSVE